MTSLLEKTSFATTIFTGTMPCPACLSSSTSLSMTAVSDVFFRTTGRMFDLSVCSSCGCLFLNPAPTEKEIAGFYPPHYWWRSSSNRLRKLESVYRRLALCGHVAFIEQTERSLRMTNRRSSPICLLDVGCGSGTVLGILREKGFQVCGFDSSSEAARVAQSENNVAVVSGSSLQDAQFAPASFDVVTLFHVLEHVTDPRALLKEIRCILKQHGRIVVQVPNIDSWQFRLLERSWYGLDVPRHVVNYSSRTAQRLLSDAGFKIHRTRHFNLRDNAPALASSLFPRLDPASRAVHQRRLDSDEPAALAWSKHLLYLAAVAAALPFAVAEAAAGCGATVMIEAEKI